MTVTILQHSKGAGELLRALPARFIGFDVPAVLGDRDYHWMPVPVPMHRAWPWTQLPAVKTKPARKPLTRIVRTAAYLPGAATLDKRETFQQNNMLLRCCREKKRLCYIENATQLSRCWRLKSMKSSSRDAAVVQSHGSEGLPYTNH